MKNREVIFVIVTVLVLSCLSLAAPGDRARPQELYSQYETFSRVVGRVAANYVEEVDVKKLFYGAYQGMLQTLDPHSAFLPPESADNLKVETKGEFGGLGIEITLDKHGVLTVVAPIEGSPAFKAGVLAGDRIIKIEGKTTKGISLREAVKKLRGPQGKPVNITVFHEGGKSEDIQVVRDIIKLESARDPHFVDKERKIAYIRLSAFQANTAESLDKIISKLRRQGMKALVLDLRFNPGGLLSAAIEVADRFLSQGVIVSTRGRSSPARVFRAAQQGTYPDFPLAVLISGRSASASEIVAGAIRDHRRGILVGMRTYGKGSVQTLFSLEGGRSAIRLTTAYYYTPSGRLIHRNINNPDQESWGIDPDIEVRVTLEEEVGLWNRWRDDHVRRARERDNKGKKKNGEGEGKGSKKGPAKNGPAKNGPDKEPGTPGQQPKGTDEAPRPVRDRTLEAAVNALQGMLILQQRAAPGAQDTAK